jgi:serine/threonine protein phosphatase PrpC
VSLRSSLGTFQNIGDRPEQQDSFSVSDLRNKALCDERGILLTLADGMGGLENGKAVSNLLVNSMQGAFVNRPMDTDPGPWLLEVLGEANRQVNAYLKGKKPSGSTLIAALIQGNKLYHLSLGDSRLYLARGGGLIPLNREQNYGSKLDLMLLKEVLPPDVIASHPHRRALTSYVGMGDLEGIDRNTVPVTLLPGDTLLLLTDGVFGTLSERAIAGALTSDAETSAVRLERMVLEQHKPHQDNFTGVIYHCE